MANIGGGTSITTTNNNIITNMSTTADFWSQYQEEAAATAGGTDVALPSVVVAGIPLTAAVSKAIVFLKARMIENTNAAANKLSGTQYIQIKKSTDSAYSNAMTLIDDLFSIAASTREPGDVIMGDINVSAIVTGNGTYNFKWLAALVDQNNLNFNDVQIGLRVWYA
jgi:hypothetical protein